MESPVPQNFANVKEEMDSKMVQVKLLNHDLWQQFHELETEMIITKTGRRLFPSLRVQINNLEPNAHYCIYVEMVPLSKCRFKYSTSGGWVPAGAEESQSANRVYMHPESPSLGQRWMSYPVMFSRMKLTNTTNPPPGHLVMTSMHKYQPRIIIVKTADPRRISWAPTSTFVFPETQFIAVTAYQNDKITKLKIDNNPFAKGFREDGQAQCKRKRKQPSGSPSKQSSSDEEDLIIDVEEENPQENSTKCKITEERISLNSPNNSISSDSNDRTLSPASYHYNPYTCYASLSSLSPYSNQTNSLEYYQSPYNYYNYPYWTTANYPYEVLRYPFAFMSNSPVRNLNNIEEAVSSCKNKIIENNNNNEKVAAGKNLTDFSIRAIIGTF